MFVSYGGASWYGYCRLLTVANNRLITQQVIAGPSEKKARCFASAMTPANLEKTTLLLVGAAAERGAANGANP